MSAQGPWPYQALGFRRVKNPGFGFRFRWGFGIQGAGFRVSGLVLTAQASKSKSLEDLGWKVQCFKLRASCAKKGWG